MGFVCTDGTGLGQAYRQVMLVPQLFVSFSARAAFKIGVDSSKFCEALSSLKEAFLSVPPKTDKHKKNACYDRGTVPF